LGEDVSLPAPSYGGSSVAISPDGTRLAYASGMPVKLFTRRLDQSKATELAGTQGASIPFFSPDGQWVGFSVGNKLNKISVEGGAAVPLGDIGNFGGASWGNDGSILVSDVFGKGLVKVPDGGGPPETVAGLGNGDAALDNPQILPGGKAILYSAYHGTEAGKGNIEVLTLTDHRRKILVRGGAYPVTSPPRAGLAIWSTSTMQHCSRSRLIWTSWKRAERLCRFWTTSPIRAPAGRANLTSQAPAPWSTVGPAATCVQ
jgi:Tol biopolymer transport system component